MVIRKEDMDEKFNILVKTTASTEIVVLLNALTVSEAEVEFCGCEDFWILHNPDERLYPEVHTVQIELFVVVHFFQFEAIQLSIVNFINFWIGLVIPVITELI